MIDGRIAVNYVVKCDTCEQWEDGEEWKKSSFTTNIRCKGWRKRAGKWICPDCIAEREDSLTPSDYASKASTSVGSIG